MQRGHLDGNATPRLLLDTVDNHAFSTPIHARNLCMALRRFALTCILASVQGATSCNQTCGTQTCGDFLTTAITCNELSVMGCDCGQCCGGLAPPPPPLTECVNGTIFDRSLEACQRCAAGTWANRGTWHKCEPAASHQYITEPGSEEEDIRACPPNTLYQYPVLRLSPFGIELLTQRGAKSAVDCSCVPGTYRSETTGECVRCGKGSRCIGGTFPPYAKGGYGLYTPAAAGATEMDCVCTCQSPDDGNILRERSFFAGSEALCTKMHCEGRFSECLDPQSNIGSLVHAKYTRASIFLECSHSDHCLGGRLLPPAWADASDAGSVMGVPCSAPVGLVPPPPSPPSGISNCFCKCQSPEDGNILHEESFSVPRKELCSESNCESRFSQCYDPLANDGSLIEATFIGADESTCVDDDCTCECCHMVSSQEGIGATTQGFCPLLAVRRFRAGSPGLCNPLRCHQYFPSSCPAARQGGTVQATHNESVPVCAATKQEDFGALLPPCIATVEPSSCAGGRNASSALCSVCAEGYAQWTSGSCHQCWSNMKIIYLFFAVALVCVWFPLLRQVMIKWVPSAYISISFIQFLGMFNTMAVGWSDQLESLYESFALFNLNLDYVHFACVDQLRFRDVWLCQMGLPLAYVAYATLQISITYAATRLALKSKPVAKLCVRVGWVPDRNQLRLSTLTDPYIARGLFFLNMYYYSGLFTSISMLRCESDGLGGEFLRAEPELVCWRGLHAHYSTAAWAFTLFYCLVVPLTVVWVLLVRIPLRGLQDRRTGALFGFLYRRFVKEFYWWEAVEILRKAIFVFVITST